jgi:hypothetical protein
MSALTRESALACLGVAHPLQRTKSGLGRGGRIQGAPLSGCDETPALRDMSLDFLRAPCLDAWMRSAWMHGCRPHLATHTHPRTYLHYTHLHAPERAHAHAHARVG